MHVRARPSAVALYGALLAHTLVSAGNYLFAKRALMEIPALPLGLLRFAGASLLVLPALRHLSLVERPELARLRPGHAMAKRLKAMGQPRYQNDGDLGTSTPGSVPPATMLPWPGRCDSTSRAWPCAGRTDYPFGRAQAAMLASRFAAPIGGSGAAVVPHEVTFRDRGGRLRGRPWMSGTSGHTSRRCPMTS